MLHLPESRVFGFVIQCLFVIEDFCQCLFNVHIDSLLKFYWVENLKGGMPTVGTPPRKSDFYQKSYFDAMESLQKSLLLHPLYFFLFVTYISSMALIRYHRVILFLVEVC